jgi:hypothetical protein
VPPANRSARYRVAVCVILHEHFPDRSTPELKFTGTDTECAGPRLPRTGIRLERSKHRASCRQVNDPLYKAVPGSCSLLHAACHSDYRIVSVTNLEQLCLKTGKHRCIGPRKSCGNRGHGAGLTGHDAVSGQPDTENFLIPAIGLHGHVRRHTILVDDRHEMQVRTSTRQAKQQTKNKSPEQTCILDTKYAGNRDTSILVGKHARLTPLPAICDLVHNFPLFARLPVTRAALATPCTAYTMPIEISHLSGGHSCSPFASGLARVMSQQR